MRKMMGTEDRDSQELKLALAVGKQAHDNRPFQPEGQNNTLGKRRQRRCRVTTVKVMRFIGQAILLAAA
jgi:hypothetical protein